MLRNTKSRGAEPPALQKKAFVLAGRKNDNITASALQDFSSCVPCALNPPDTPQPHARLVEDGGIDGHGPLHVEVAQGLRGCVTIVDEHPISKIKVLALYGEVIHWHGVGR